MELIINGSTCVDTSLIFLSVLEAPTRVTRLIRNRQRRMSNIVGHATCEAQLYSCESKYLKELQLIRYGSRHNGAFSTGKLITCGQLSDNFLIQTRPECEHNLKILVWL